MARLSRRRAASRGNVSSTFAFSSAPLSLRAFLRGLPATKPKGQELQCCPLGSSLPNS